MTITLNLNGHTLDLKPGYQYIVINGSLTLIGEGNIDIKTHVMGIDVNGTFIMKDGSINSHFDYGSNVYVSESGNFIMEGGSIVRGNYGVYLSGGSFTMNGGLITGNEDGVYITEEGSFFTMNGGIISGNKVSAVLNRQGTFTLCGGTITDKFRLYGSVITIGSKLDESSCYKVTMDTPGVFTSGLNGKGTAANFDSTYEDGYVILNDDGETVLIEDGNSAGYIERSWSDGKVKSEKKTKLSDWQEFQENDSVPAGWYYLNRDVTVNGRVSLTGDTYLILGDGKKLDVKGLYVPEGSTLTIYGQSAGTGKIYSHPSGGAAIGGYSKHNNGDIVIHGGTIEANGYDHCAGIGSNDGCTGGFITIYGGTVTTYSRDGAGIGGGDDGDGGTITINGGKITSTSVNRGQGARIGGGSDADPGTITINGGTITTSSGLGAGIGGGYKNTSGGSVTINGGVIKASGDYGIGSGEEGSDVSITMGYTDATKNTISVTSVNYGGTVTLNDDFVQKDTDIILKNGTYTDTSQMAGVTLIPYESEDPIPVAAINGVTGSFNDKIKLNYYFDFPDKVLADDAAYVTLSNEDTETMLTLPIKEASFTEGKGYKFSIPLAAKEAGDTITARVYDGRGNALPVKGAKSGNDYTQTGVQYTLMQYFDWLTKESEDDHEKAVGAAARDYCIAAQIYFGYHSSGLSVSDDVTDLDAAALSAFASEKSGTLPTGVSIKGISAMLESDNTIRLYFSFKDVDPSGFTYAIDGKPVSLSQRPDGEYYLALEEGAYSNHLQDTHTYSVSDGTDTYMITASVLTYARSCVIKKKGTEEEKNLGKALYLYNAAAVAAFGQ